MIFEGLRKCDTLAATENRVKLPVSLNDKDLEYLEAACMLHNIGLITGEKGYHKQSCNIIMVCTLRLFLECFYNMHRHYRIMTCLKIIKPKCAS